MSRLAQRRRNKLHPPKKISFGWTRKLFKYFFLITIVIILVLGLLSIPRLIKITQINCSSQFGPCSFSLNEKMMSLQNNDYHTLKTRLPQILSKEFLISEYEFRLNLPNTIDIYVVERKPEVAITKQNSPNSFALLDSNGVVLTTEEKTSLPVLLIKQDINYSVGDTMPNSIIFATQVLKNIANLYNIKLAILEPDGIVFELSEDKKVIFPLSGNLDELFGALTLILSRLNSIPEASTIDLRFKNPVLN